MIFDANGSTTSYGSVKESKYELGLQGALMHVYENECNYNAMMRSIGLSELKYYSETGKDLFVNEAGAFSGFIEKAKVFFKKVIEKIKSIFHKFMAKINSYSQSDKDFLRKYKTEVTRKDVTDMEFTGYEKLKNGEPENCIRFSDEVSGINTSDFTVTNKTGKDMDDDGSGKNRTYADSDAVNDAIESQRGALIAGNNNGMTESEFRDELKDKLYGDKETFDVTSTIVRTALTVIDNSKDSIKKAEKELKNITKNIDKMIKQLDQLQKTLDKDYSAKNKGVDNDGNRKTASEDDSKLINRQTQNINDQITIWKALSNDYTIAYGMYVQALKDANRQAKALCVKVISYNKKESAHYESVINNDDIFAGVNFV